MEHVYGPVPSRRLGLSLGVSPIPSKYCNYSCVYCQLGRTDHLTNTRELYYPVETILQEFDEIVGRGIDYDVVTIVGEGEPTLYKGLGLLIDGIRGRTDKPVAVITNGALMYDTDVRAELFRADIVLPSLDSYDEPSFRRINRPWRTIGFREMFEGLELFTRDHKGQLWIEIMLIRGMNDGPDDLEAFAALLARLRYDRLYLNTVLRPPAEPDIVALDHEQMKKAVDRLGGSSIDLLVSSGFHSVIADDAEAIRSIIRRHPMNQHEIEGFLQSRGCGEKDSVIKDLERDPAISVIDYKGYKTFRLK